MALFLQAADVFLHAAQADNFPLSVLEAMACGKPVIATAVGGIPEEVQPGVNAILVPRGDSRAMAESIRALMENPDRRLRMGLAAASWAQERFSPDRQVQAYLSLYENLVRRPELALNAER
jgi:glycosyltransferase involved in cell wall biosynthesis